MLITAAAADKTSFGCSDDRDLTYFGEAFYRDALPKAKNLQEAFALTRRQSRRARALRARDALGSAGILWRADRAVVVAAAIATLSAIIQGAVTGLALGAVSRSDQICLPWHVSAHPSRRSIILDTNVLSALMRGRAKRASGNPVALILTAESIGCEQLPCLRLIAAALLSKGTRQRAVEAAFGQDAGGYSLENRVLDFCYITARPRQPY